VAPGVSPRLYEAETIRVNIQKIIQRRIRRRSEGVDFVGDINAAISANVGDRGSTSHVSSHSKVSAGSDTREGEKRGKEEA
jgi:hypothetical protein